MACRRGDRERLVGCWVGPVAVRGCSRGCCPYPDALKEPNERLTYYKPGVLSYKSTNLEHAPFDSLRHCDEDGGGFIRIRRPNCLHFHRPKFVCTSCRRVFKHHVHPDKEYRKQSDSSNLWESCDTLETRRRNGGNDKELQLLKARDAARRTLKIARSDAVSNAEDPYQSPSVAPLSEEFKQRNEELETYYYTEHWAQLDALCCPGCARPGVPVGTTFRAPKLKDYKSWKEVARLLAMGERFLPCMDAEEEIEAIMEGRRCVGLPTDKRLV